MSSRIEQYALDRRHAHGRARRRRRVARLAVRAPLRFAGAASPRCSATSRTATGCSPRRPAGGRPGAVPGRDARARDRVRDPRRVRCGSSTSCRSATATSHVVRDRGGACGATSRCGWSWSSASTTGRSSRGCGGSRDGIRAVAGPDGLVLRTPVHTYGENLRTYADFTVAANERLPFVLSLPRVARAGPGAARRRAGAAGDDGVVAALVVALDVRRESTRRWCAGRRSR